MLNWEKKFEIGIKDIDHQHQWIFGFCNALEKQLRDHADDVDIEHLLTSLAEYADKHFQYEEHCMTKWHCLAAATNECEHRNFLDAYQNFMERYEREGHSIQLAWKIHDMVEQWIVNHICKIDSQLKKSQLPVHV